MMVIMIRMQQRCTKKEADKENQNENGKYAMEKGNVYRDDIDDGEGEGEGDEELEEEGC